MRTEVRCARDYAKYLRRINRKLEYNASLEQAAKLMYYNSFKELKEANRVWIPAEPSGIKFIRSHSEGGNMVAEFGPLGSWTFGGISESIGSDVITVSHSVFSKKVD